MKPFGDYYETELYPALESLGEYMRARGIDSIEIPIDPDSMRRRRDMRGRVRALAAAAAAEPARIAFDLLESK